MKPKLKTETFVRSYWVCGNAKHRHKTKAVAARCLAVRRVTKPSRQCTHKLMREIQSYRDAGETHKKIGERFQLSGGRIGQILHKWMRVKARQKAKKVGMAWLKENLAKDLEQALS